MENKVILVKLSWFSRKIYFLSSGSSDIQWCFSQVKGTLDDDVTEGKKKKKQWKIIFVDAKNF